MDNVENIITDNLPIWSSAIQSKSSAGRGTSSKRNLYGVKKLRELILDLAVRGLLVPQDPNDEPASVLLEKIAAEKERLVKEGKIKKQKSLPIITELEKLFSLPGNWSWTRAQDISTYIQRGKSPKYDEKGQVKVISQKCVQWSGLDLKPARSIDNNSLDAYQPERFLCDDDLLWNSTGTGTVGRITIVSEVPLKSMVADSHVTVLRINKANKIYIKTYISSAYVQKRINPEHENSLVSGSTKQVELNTSSVINLPVPIPPLAEQHRIVAKVDELMALCDTLEQQQEDSIQAHETLVGVLLEALSSAVDADAFQAAWAHISKNFDALFTTNHSINKLKETILQLAVMGKLVPQDPSDEPASILLEKIAAERDRLVKEGKIKKKKPSPDIDENKKNFKAPSNWRWVRLDSISEFINGYAFKSSDFNDNGIGVVKIGDIQNGLISEKNMSRVSSKVLEPLNENLKISKHDMVIAMSGATTGKLGFSLSEETYYLNQRVGKIITHICDPKYIYFPLTTKIAENLAQARGMAIPNLSTAQINEIVLALPPLSEQHRIVAKVDELMGLCDQLKSSLQQAQETQILLTDAVVENAL